MSSSNPALASSPTFRSLTSPLLMSSGLSLTNLMEIAAASTTFSPGVALAEENTTGGGLNAEEIQDGTEVRISVAASGAKAGDLLNVFIDGVLVVQHALLASEISNGQGTGDGIAKLKIPAAVLQSLSQGQHALTSQIDYGNGQLSGVSTPSMFEIDTVAPNAPTKPIGTDDAGQETGDIADYSVIDDATPLISGRIAEPGNYIDVYDNGQFLGTVYADVTGQWTFKMGIPLLDGTHAISVVEHDRVGNPSPMSAALHFTVDTGAVRVAITKAIDNVGLIQGDLSHDSVTDDAQATLVGTARANALVTIKDGPTVLGTTMADAQGQWTFTPTVVQTEGNHTYTASITVAGNTATSVDFELNIDTRPPKVVVTSIGDGLKTAAEATDAAGVITVLGEFNSTSTVVFQGQKGAVTKTLFNNGTAKPVVLSALDLLQLGDGAVEVTTTTQDKAGNLTVTVDNNDGDFILDTKPPKAVADVVNVTEDVISLSNNLSANDTDKDGTETYSLIGSNQGSYGYLLINDDGSYTYTRNENLNSIQTTASDVFTYLVHDAAGNPATSTLTINMTPVNDAPTLATPLVDQMAALNKAFSYTVPANSFTDVDSTLTYSATLADGSALPAWLTFNALTRTFSGTPTTTADVNVKVTASDGSLSASDTFLIGVPPVVNSVAISNATGIQNQYLNAGDVLTASVTFSEAVTVTGNPTLALNVGGAVVQAQYANCVGNTVTFNYTIAAGQTDTNGISMGANAMSVGGGAIKDASGHNAILTTAAVLDNANYMVDTSAPTLSMSMASTSLSAGQSTKVTFSFSEAVNGFASSDVIVPNGSLSAFTAVDAKTWTATFTADSSTSSNYLSVAANSFADMAGNNGVAASGPTYSLNTSVQDIAKYLGLTYDGGLNHCSWGTVETSIIGKTSVNSSYFWNTAWNDVLSRATFTLHRVHGCCDTVVDTAKFNTWNQRVTFDEVGCNWSGDSFYATVTYNGSTAAVKYGFTYNICCWNSWAKNYTYNTPLLLDLNGDGVQTVSMQEGVQFDLTNTGSKQSVGWATKQDGWLSMDLNADGQIDSGAELFGEHTRLADGSLAKDGWAALAQFDTNGDGKMDAQDARFNDLRVWVDANSDGVTDAGELRTLTQANISSVDLAHDGNLAGQNGNVLQGFSTFTTTDGVKHEIADALLQTGTNTDSDSGEKAIADVVRLTDVLPAPDWQANTVNSVHAAYTLNSSSLLNDELMYKMAA